MASAFGTGSAGLQRSIDASAARYAALAKHYGMVANAK
jgi:hypothetical protein